jgi:ribosome-associated protein
MGAMDRDDDIRTPGGILVPAHAVTWTFARSGGAGGQHVNKTSTKVTLAIAIDAVVTTTARAERLRVAFGDELRVTDQSTRSQSRNRQVCLDRAAEVLDAAARPPRAARKATKPSARANERRLDSKRRDSRTKQLRRFPDET